MQMRACTVAAAAHVANDLSAGHLLPHCNGKGTHVAIGCRHPGPMVNTDKTPVAAIESGRCHAACRGSLYRCAKVRCNIKTGKEHLATAKGIGPQPIKGTDFSAVKGPAIGPVTRT